MPGSTVRALAQTPDGRIWVATEGGMAHLEGNRFIPLPPTPGFERINDVTALATDGAGTLWMVAPTGEPICLRDGKLSDCLPDGNRINRKVHIVDIEVDARGRVWLGTNDLVYIFDRGELSWPGSFPDEAIGPLCCVQPRADGGAWIGGKNGLFRRQNDGSIPPHPLPGRASPAITALAGGSGEALWVASEGFLARVASGGDRSWGSAEGLPQGRIADVLESHAGDLWLAGSMGLIHGRPTDTPGWQLLTTQNSRLPANETTALLEAADGKIWVGTAGGGVARLTVAVATAKAKADEAPASGRGARWPLGLVAVAIVGALAAWLRRRRRHHAGRPSSPIN